MTIRWTGPLGKTLHFLAVAGTQKPEETEPTLKVETSVDLEAHPSHPINFRVFHLDPDLDAELFGEPGEARAPGTDLWLSRSAAERLRNTLHRLIEATKEKKS